MLQAFVSTPSERTNLRWARAARAFVVAAAVMADTAAMIMRDRYPMASSLDDGLW